MAQIGKLAADLSTDDLKAKAPKKRKDSLAEFMMKGDSKPTQEQLDEFFNPVMEELRNSENFQNVAAEITKIVEGFCGLLVTYTEWTVEDGESLIREHGIAGATVLLSVKNTLLDTMLMTMHQACGMVLAAGDEQMKARVNASLTLAAVKLSDLHEQSHKILSQAIERVHNEQEGFSD